MVYAVVGLVSLGAAVLTFFTGFGLGTLLLPPMLLFFEPPVAIGLVAVVHFATGLFKLALLGRHADFRLAAWFGIPAAAAAFAGASALVSLSSGEVLWRWGRGFEVTPLKLVLAALMLTFAGLEASKRWAAVQVPKRYAPLGGLLTGFFGGLSGHQGALRSAFLLRAGLGKEALLATGVVIAVGVDLARLAVYARLAPVGFAAHGPVLAVAIACACAGAVAGNLLLTKVTLGGLQKATAALLGLVALGLGLGLL